jgi:hypothetical protein
MLTVEDGMKNGDAKRRLDEKREEGGRKSVEVEWEGGRNRMAMRLRFWL